MHWSSIQVTKRDLPGVNYYTTNYVESAPSSNGVNVSYVSDRQATLTSMLKN